MRLLLRHRLPLILRHEACLAVQSLVSTPLLSSRSGPVLAIMLRRYVHKDRAVNDQSQQLNSEGSPDRQQRGLHSPRQCR